MKAFVGASWLAALIMVAFPHGTRSAPPVTRPSPGLRENTPAIHALVGATVIARPGDTLKNATIVVRDGVIEQVGSDIKPPADATIWDCAGKTIYAGFIDAYSELSSGSNQPRAPAAGYWNANVTPELSAATVYAADADTLKKLRAQGFTARLVAPAAGIVHGTSALVTTGDDEAARTILASDVALHAVLAPSRNATGYPRSPMGAMTLVRQVFHDADWYQKAWRAFENEPGMPRPERNDSLAAIARLKSEGTPVVLRAVDELYFMRADQVAREFDLDLIVLGSGEEYQRLDQIKEAGRRVIVPLNFPRTPAVNSPEMAMSVSLETLLHWDLAASNPGRLAEAGVSIALTTRGLRELDQFLPALRKAVARGLPREAALTALTTAPAEWYGVGERLGAIEPGKAANLVVASGELFDRATKIEATWVDGRRYAIAPEPLADLRGEWELNVSRSDGGTESIMLNLEGEADDLSGDLTRGDKETELKRVALEGSQVIGGLDGKALGWEGVVRFSASLLIERDETLSDASLRGEFTFADGSREAFVGKYNGKPPAAKDDADTKTAAKTKKGKTKNRDSNVEDRDKNSPLFEVNYPLGDFGIARAPTAGTYLFTNATVWTCAADGVMENASVLIVDGKIAAVGTDIEAPEEAVVVDCHARHITPGVIDCHSHIATDGGVNESGQTITAEVRIGDFIDPNDINIYRQLAGGVTTSNILHGSANTIGGQCQVVKFRWGATAEELKFAAAPPSIKFALGENVKQSNNGRASTRYPQTRMGVEQLLVDAFTAAVEYRARWKEWRREPSGSPPRVDLELEALVEVLEGKRLVHCHSYRQDEILVLLRVCERFGVRVATLQHILEGYKLADTIAKHGAGGSSFSDWWAYKYEVIDAIPFNGAMMHRAGVVVSFNSDDAELARRLNLEAAKAIKYGDVDPIEALKFVTLNPAKQLGIDQHVGSIEVGKDADLAIWNAAPMSVYARCEQTWVDGRKYFDRQDDLAQRVEVARMRQALIQRALGAGGPTALPGEEDTDKVLWPREDIYCMHHDDGDHTHLHLEHHDEE